VEKEKKQISDDLSLENMVRRFRNRLARQQSEGKEKSKILFTEAMANYFERAGTARKEGKPLVFTSVLAFPEIFTALGTIPFAPAQYCIQLMVQGFSSQYIDRGVAFGVSKEVCSANTASVGMAADGIFPQPDLQFATAQQPCDPAVVESELLNLIYKVPIYWFNIPYRLGEATADFFKDEFRGLIDFIQERTRLTYDKDKLWECLHISKEAHTWYQKIQDLRLDTVPTPIGCREAYSAYSSRVFMEGRPETIEINKAAYEEVKAKADAKEGVVPNERHRIVVNGAYPFWNMRLFDWMEQEFGAVVAVDFNNSISMDTLDYDTDDPIEYAGRKAMGANLAVKVACAPYPEFAEETGRSAKRAQCDASIFFTHFGCKMSCGSHKVFSDALMDIAGIPTAVVDIDAYDKRIVSESQIKASISSYFKMLEGR
jgi:hypothetical protein